MYFAGVDAVNYRLFLTAIIAFCENLKVFGLCLNISEVCDNALFLSLVELPNKAVTLKCASGIGEGLLIVENTIDEVIYLVLCLLGLIVEIPSDVTGIFAGSNVGTHIVNEGHNAIVVLVLEEAVLGVYLKIVNMGGAARTPGAEVVAHSAVCKLDNYVAGTFLFHPRSAGVGSHMESLDGLTEEAEHNVDVVTAVAE